MKTALLNILLVLASLIFCLGLGEVALRLVPPAPPARWVDRPDFYYAPKGSENFQGNVYPKEKPNGVFRVAVVGDSFTFAPFMQFDDSFVARLERMMNLDRGARRAEVLNYGVPGFSTRHEVPLVKQALQEGADLIILQVTLNDPERKPYHPDGITIQTNQQGAAVIDTDAPDSWIARHSRLYRFLFRRVSVYKQGKSYEDYFRDLFADKAAMSEFSGALAQIRDLTKEKNVALAAVVFPLFGSKLDDSYPFHGIHQTIGGLLDALGVPRLDLESAYKGIPAERLQVMPGEDFHPNEIGHRIASEQIYCWLRKSKLIPEEFRAQTLMKQRVRLRFPVTQAKNGASSGLSEECQ